LSLVEAVIREEAQLEAIRARNLESFSDIPLPPSLLEMEQAFLVKQNPLSQTRITTSDDDSEEEEDEYIIPSSPLGRMRLGRANSEDWERETDMDLCSSPPRSVATVDSFDQRNQDFLRFQ
jgi:hypothetical protein